MVREAEHSVGVLKCASLPSTLQTVGTAPLSPFTAGARGGETTQILRQNCQKFELYTFEIPGTDTQAKTNCHMGKGIGSLSWEDKS